MPKHSIFQKTLSLLLVGVLLAAVTIIGYSAQPDYSIGNPYASVNWEIWNTYKAQLHCQTNASDGSIPMNTVIEEHYKLDYDILAITDHMTLGSHWDEAPKTVPLMRLVKYAQTKMLPVTPLSTERRTEILNGVGRDGRGMLEITRGVEMNGMSPNNAHINGYFCDYGQGTGGIDGDYETMARRVQEAGGITFLDHLGMFTKAGKNDDPSISSDPKYVNKFARIFLDYASCVGMDINSSEDNHTQYDRILYDNILTKTIPYGIVPWVFSFSDEHSPGEFDRAFTMHLMPELTEDALRTSMEDGTFFAVARHTLYEQEYVSEPLHGKDMGPVPQINEIKVNENAGTITIDADSYERISWVSNGRVISNEATLDIAALDAEIGSFVRAYLVGSDAILYVQPFTVLRAGQVLEKETIPQTRDYSYYLRLFVDALLQYCAPIRVIWNLLAHFDPAYDLKF